MRNEEGPDESLQPGSAQGLAPPGRQMPEAITFQHRCENTISTAMEEKSKLGFYRISPNTTYTASATSSGES